MAQPTPQELAQQQAGSLPWNGTSAQPERTAPTAQNLIHAAEVYVRANEYVDSQSQLQTQTGYGYEDYQQAVREQRRAREELTRLVRSTDRTVIDQARDQLDSQIRGAARANNDAEARSLQQVARTLSEVIGEVAAQRERQQAPARPAPNR